MIDGFSGYISYMPQANIGIVVLANNRAAYRLAQFLSYDIYDRLLNLKGFSWDKVIDGERPRYRATPEKPGRPQAGPEKTPYPLEKYSGSYTHKAYGKAAVYVENGELRLNFNTGPVRPLEHCFFNVFKSELSGSPLQVEFSLDLQGNVMALEIQIEGTDFHIVLGKLAEK